MSNFGNNLSFNIFSTLKNLSNKAKDVLQNKNQVQQPLEKDIQPNQQTQVKPNQSQTLLNTNSNIPLNQSTLTNNALNQTSLNTVNQNQTNLNMELRNNLNNNQPQATPVQGDFQGAKDLPAYAGISNMSLKSWIAGQDNNSMAKNESGEKQLTSTLEGIKGFQKQNYEGSDDGSNRQSGSSKLSKNKALLILSHIFSSVEQSGAQETEVLVNLSNFKKLGSSTNTESTLSQNENSDEVKLSPPLPGEFENQPNLDKLQVKYLHHLLSLPNEFPECLRLFAKDTIEIKPKELESYLIQRLELLQGQLFGTDSPINDVIAKFAPLLNQNDYSLLLPLVLLYYPLPLPVVKDNFDFLEEWAKRKNEENVTENIIATCEIFYLSKIRGRFLIKLKINDKQEFSFDIQTNEGNNGIVRDLETSIAQIMRLLEHPPLLSDLNVILTKEIYEATDSDEELAIVTTGPIRLEIILATYAILIVLNKLNEDPDPAGLIEMAD